MTIEVKDKSECWPWRGATTGIGYGVVTVDNKSMRVARHTYRLFVGSIPKNMVVMHTCDNPPCCNPAHLKLGTHRDNTADMTAKGRAGGRFGVGFDVRRGGKMNALWVQQIRLLADCSFTQEELAIGYGVTQSTISGILNRKVWADI